VDSFLLQWFDNPQPSDSEPPYNVLVLADNPPRASGLAAVPQNSLAFRNLDQSVRSSIERASQLCRDIDPHRPFSRFGWANQVVQWIRSQVAALGLGLIHQCQHIKGGGKSLVLRIRTTRQPIWFKVPPNNGKEFDVTMVLSKYARRLLPHIYVADSKLRGWLMEEAGISLHEIDPASHPNGQIAQALAEVQIQTAPAVSRLLALGCQDCTLPSLDKQTDALIEAFRFSLQDQPSHHPQKLKESDLVRLQHHLHAACDRLAQCNIPNTVLHGDLTNGSILTDGQRVVFTDWEMAYVGVPLFDFHIRCDYMNSHHFEEASQFISHRETYLRRLEEGLGVRNLARAYGVVPLLTVFADVCGISMWIESSFQNEPRGRKFLRNRARLMLQASKTTLFTRALCSTKR
jgi:hypothetical protein